MVNSFRRDIVMDFLPICNGFRLVCLHDVSPMVEMLIVVILVICLMVLKLSAADVSLDGIDCSCCHVSTSCRSYADCEYLVTKVNGVNARDMLSLPRLCYYHFYLPG